jgi:putative ABC transport system ATP-binding protein
MIVFDNITLKVHHQLLLEGASLRLAEGEKVVLRGASGSGKSSLLKCAVGAIPIQEGIIRIDDVELSAQTVSDIRTRLAFIGQEPVLGTERVREALLLPFGFKAHRHALPEKSKIGQLLERLHLAPDILDKPCARISGGEKQRIAIARALLLNKTIFLADEITSALDPESRQAVMDELFRPGITLLSISHDPLWIARGNRVIEITDHQLKDSVALSAAAFAEENDPISANRKSGIKNAGSGGAA